MSIFNKSDLLIKSAGEVKSEDAVAEVQAELSIPTSDPILGELVYYNDFEVASGYEIDANVSKGTTLITYLNSEFSTVVTLKNGGTSTVLTIVADPKNEKGQVLKVTPANTSALPENVKARIEAIVALAK